MEKPGVKIMVAVKSEVDCNVKVRVKSDNAGVGIANVKMSMNPCDAIAVEEAVRLKGVGAATELIAVSAGGAQAQETLSLQLPAVVTTDLHLTAPRDVTLPTITKAKKAPQETTKPEVRGMNIAPQRHIAEGIPGAIRHPAGMADSKVIVATDKDLEEAPLFNVADYGLVGSLCERIPEVTDAV